MPIIIKCKSCGFTLLKIEGNLGGTNPIDKIVKELGYVWENTILKKLVVRCPVCLSKLAIKLPTLEINENEIEFIVKPRSKH